MCNKKVFTAEKSLKLHEIDTYLRVSVRKRLNACHTRNVATRTAFFSFCVGAEKKEVWWISIEFLCSQIYNF